MYQPIEITERTRKLKEEYLKMPVPMETNPYVDKKYHVVSGGSLDDAGISGRLGLANKNAETTLRRLSYAEAGELYAAQPVITENELITGNL